MFIIAKRYVSYITGPLNIKEKCISLILSSLDRIFFSLCFIFMQTALPITFTLETVRSTKTKQQQHPQHQQKYNNIKNNRNMSISSKKQQCSMKIYSSQLFKKSKQRRHIVSSIKCFFNALSHHYTGSAKAPRQSPSSPCGRFLHVFRQNHYSQSTVICIKNGFSTFN